MDKPRFKHDCDRCIFLGQLKERGEQDPTADIYFCPSRFPTVLARYSCKDSDYSSSDIMDGPEYLPRLSRWKLFAMILASQKGLYKFPATKKI